MVIGLIHAIRDILLVVHRAYVQHRVHHGIIPRQPAVAPNLAPLQTVQVREHIQIHVMVNMNLVVIPQTVLRAVVVHHGDEPPQAPALYKVVIKVIKSVVIRVHVQQIAHL